METLIAEKYLSTVSDFKIGTWLFKALLDPFVYYPGLIRLFKINLILSVLIMKVKILLQKFNARKHHWSGVKFPVTLEVTPCSLDQLDPTTNTIFASYNFKDFDGIIGNVEGMNHLNLNKIQ
jgi:hypothetical protein